MNDYNDLMNEYEEVKKDISNESMDISNTIIRIKNFQAGLELFSNDLLLLKQQKSKFFDVVDKNNIEFSRLLSKEKQYIENEIIFPLKSLLEDAKNVSLKNLDKFNEIKISLIQERQKLNKTKDDYFNFINQEKNQNFENDDENLLYNAKKENLLQLYKYEVNQMNTIIEENNTKYKIMYNDLEAWKEIQKDKIQSYFFKFANNIEKVGNLFLDFSKNLIKDLKEAKEVKKTELINKDNNILRNPRFEKVFVEERKEENKDFKKIKELKKEENSENNKNIMYDKPLGVKSKNIINDDFFDFDIIGNDEINDIKEMENKTEIKGKKSKIKNSIFDKIKKKNKNNSEIHLDLKKSKLSNSSEKDEFELVGKNIIINENNSGEKTEKLLDNIISKIISSDELLSQEISDLMNILKQENFETKKSYSLTFLTKLSKLNNKYVINLKNRKNFMHLSNILNDITINDNNIDILKLIIEISQIITYKDLYLFNILGKKNRYLGTKTFWSKLIIDFFINDLNIQAKKILKPQKNSKDNNSNDKIKESNIYLLEYIKFSEKITIYKKLNSEQKLKLDKYARNNIINILTKIIEGMCSFYVKRNIVLDVISDFGKNFAFNPEDNDYYKLLVEAYLNRNYIYNLRQLSLGEKKDEKMAKIIIISNAAKFLPKTDFIKLLILEKSMKEPIKNNIFKNFLLNKKITIDERMRIWELLLNVSKAEKEYNYTEILSGIKKQIEANEIKKKTDAYKNIEMIKLDVDRTFFIDRSKSKEYQQSLKNILMCLVHIFNDVGYFQGMNYIAAFLLQLFDFNEQKAFYCMLAIQKNTEFKNIFKNDLYLLRNFFEVFKKILKIYIPEIYTHLKNNEVNENYYLPPWFLTLFTFSCIIFEKKDAPKFIFLIIEDFFLNGWSAIFNAGYTVIKHHKNEIMSMKMDKTLHYLVNNFCKEETKNENFENIKKEYVKNSYQINDELISRLLNIVKYEENKNKSN